MGNADQSRAADEVEFLRKALDEEAWQRVDLQRQLDQANGEFEEFVSMAAHNLRDILWMMRTSGQGRKTNARRLPSFSAQALILTNLK